jgi:hypothetical protein
VWSRLVFNAGRRVESEEDGALQGKKRVQATVTRGNAELLKRIPASDPESLDSQMPPCYPWKHGSSISAQILQFMDIQRISMDSLILGLLMMMFRYLCS